MQTVSTSVNALEEAIESGKIKSDTAKIIKIMKKISVKTCGEYAQLLGWWPNRSKAARRISELKLWGWVKVIGKRKCMMTGAIAEIYALVDIIPSHIPEPKKYMRVEVSEYAYLKRCEAECKIWKSKAMCNQHQLQGQQLLFK